MRMRSNRSIASSATATVCSSSECNLAGGTPPGGYLAVSPLDANTYKTDPSQNIPNKWVIGKIFKINDLWVKSGAPTICRGFLLTLLFQYDAWSRTNTPTRSPFV